MNGAIYYMREFIENKTQNLLINNNHKSPVDYSVFHEQQIKISDLQTSLLSSQDREKIAKELEQASDSEKHNVTIDRDKYKAQFNAQIKSNTSITEKLDLSVKQGKENEGVIESYASSQSRLKKEIKDFENERELLLFRNNTIIQRLSMWANNSNNEYINLISHIDTKQNGIDKEANERIQRLLKSKIIYSDATESELTELLTRINVSNKVKSITDQLNGIINPERESLDVQKN